MTWDETQKNDFTLIQNIAWTSWKESRIYGQPSRLWQMVIPTLKTQRSHAKIAKGNKRKRNAKVVSADGGWESGGPRGNLCFWSSWYVMTNTSFHKNDFYGVPHIYIFIYIYIYVYIYIYIYIYIYMFMFIFIFIFKFILIFISIFIFIFLFIFIFILYACVWCMHACMHVCMYVCGICCPHARFNYRNVSCIEGSVQDEIHGTMVLLSFCCLNTFLNHRDCWSSNILAMVGRWVSRVRPVEDENPKCHMVCGVCCFWSDALYHS